MSLNAAVEFGRSANRVGDLIKSGRFAGYEQLGMANRLKRKTPDMDRSHRYFAYLSLAAFACCVVVRAPMILSEVEVPVIHLKLKLNAGYVLIFGPLLITCAIVGILYITKKRRTKPRNISVTQLAIRLASLILTIFLSVQFFLLLAPTGECNTFSSWRYLTDWNLRSFKPQYCMSLPTDVQALMPWLIEPPILQGWLQLLLPLIVLALIVFELRGARVS